MENNGFVHVTGEKVLPPPNPSSLQVDTTKEIRNMSLKTQNLLKSTKIATLVPSKSAFSPFARKVYPTHQTVQTTSASHDRADYGLKAAIPSKITLRYLVVDELDLLEGITKFEPTLGHYWIKRRFQEMGMPVVPAERTKQDARVPRVLDAVGLGSGATKQDVEAWTRVLKQARKLFRKHVAHNHPDKIEPRAFNRSNLAPEAVQFLNTFQGLANEDRRFLQAPRTPQGSAGLLYLQKGRLSATSYGYSDKAVVPGRILSDGGVFGIAGFATSSPSEIGPSLAAARNVPGKHYKEVMIPVAVEKVKMRGGVVQLEASVVRKNVVGGGEGEVFGLTLRQIDEILSNM